MKKKILSFVLAFAFVLTASLCLTACQLGKDPQKDNLAYVSLDINPGIELIVDGENKVVSVRGENEDGLVLLYEETGITGEDINVAIQKITDLAIQYGYLDENNKVVETYVTSDNEKFANEILSKVNSSITAKAENLGLTVTTDGEGAYSLLRDLNELKSKFPNNQAIQNLSVSKFKLAISVSETGEISLESAVLLDDKALVEMLKNATLKIEAYATKEYLDKKAEALLIYDKLTEIQSYSVYTQYYLEKIMSHPITVYYGPAYQMYATAAKGFEAVCDTIELATKMENFSLNETEVQEIVNALGLESTEELKNSEGKITIESIEAYADKLFKNSPVSETLEQTKTALNEALKNVENIVKAKIDELVKTYKPQIEQAKETANQTLSAIEASMKLLPENIKTVFNSITADLKTILNTIEEMLNNNTINLENLKEQTNSLKVKANNYLNKIKSDLSTQEYAELEAKVKAEIDKMASQKQAFENSLNVAANEAKSYLQSLKNARKK